MSAPKINPQTLEGGVGNGAPAGASPVMGGGRRGVSVRALKKMLKKAHLKTTGRKSVLTRRARKAGLKMRGGEDECPEGMQKDASGNCVATTPPAGGKSKRGSRKSLMRKLF